MSRLVLFGQNHFLITWIIAGLIFLAFACSICSAIILLILSIKTLIKFLFKRLFT